MSDVTLTIGVQSGSLQSSIKKEINAASKEKLTVDVKANKETLKQSIEGIKLKKIPIQVDKQAFKNSVNLNIDELAGKFHKLKVAVDKGYLKRSIDSAIKGIGSTGSTSQTGSGSGSGSSSNNNTKALREEATNASLTTRVYSETNKVRTASQNIASNSEEYKGLQENKQKLEELATAYDGVKNKNAEYRAELANLTKENARYINSAKENGKYTTQSVSLLSKLRSGLMAVTTVIRGINTLRMVFRPLVNAVTEVDTALTQLKIVTKATDDELQAYSADIMVVADRTAGSVKDLINSTTTFSRLGYSLDESTTLAEYTQMLENVGAIDESSATSAITAIVKAFGVGEEDLESVMDKMVDVGNNFPISVSEIAEGMNNAGSMLAMATDKNVEQSIALLTAANTTIQNISKSSTGLRTIAARIRNVKADLDDLGETMTKVEYDEIVQALTQNGVALTDSNGELRNTYDILSDLSNVWQTLGENEQAALAKTLSGTRQQNVFVSLMENFNEASNAMVQMTNSEGEMTRANDKYLDSVQARVQQLKNAFVEFSQSAVSADALKNLADFAKDMLGLLSGLLKIVNVLGGLRTVLPLIISLVTILRGQTVASGLSHMWRSLEMFGTNARAMFTSLITSVKSFGSTMQATAQTTVTASQMITSAFGVIGLAVTAISAVLSFIQNAIEADREQLQKEIDAGVEASNSISDIEKAYNNYSDLAQSGSASTEELSNALDELCGALGISRSELEASKNELHSYEEAIRQAVDAAKELNLTKIKAAINAEIERQEDPAGGNIFSGAMAWIREQVNKRNISNNMTDLGRDALVSSDSDYTYDDFLTEILGVPPSDIDRATTDVTYWLDKIDDLKAHMDKIKEESKWGDQDQNYQLASQFYDFITSDIAKLKELTDSYNQGLISSIFSSDDIQDSVRNLDALQDKVESFGLKLEDTIFGNINTGNRKILEWNDENLKKYASELKSWGETAESMRGSISTVLGSSSEYDGVEIAFSPILQTSDGPILLGRNTVDKYIKTLISNLGEGWTADQLLELDAKGLANFKIQGHTVKGLIADIGETAAQTGEAMHYMGKNGEVAEQFNEIRQSMIDAVVADEGFTGSMDDAAMAVDAFLSSSDGLSGFYNDLNTAMELSSVAMSETAKGLSGINELAKRSTDAFKDLDEFLKGDVDWDTNQQKRIEYYSKLVEEMEAGNFGGRQYEALATTFGVDLSKPVEQQIESIQELSKYYEDLDQGMAAFLSDVQSKVPSAIASWDEATNKLTWDPTKLNDFAKALGITEEMLTDMMNTFRMGVTPADWIDLTPDMLAGWMKVDGLISGVGKTAVYNEEQIGKIASLYGWQTDDLIDKLKELDEYKDIKPIDVHIDTESIDASVESLRNFIASTEDVQAQIDGIVTALAGVSEEDVVKILGELDLPKELNDNVIAKLNETYGFTIETSEAEDAISAMHIQLKDQIVDYVKENDKLTFYVTDAGTLKQLQDQLKNFIAQSSKYNIEIKQKNALGTKHAQSGLSLLGDEFSASGQPKPELVVSNGRAFLAGVNGPVVRTLNAGDVVYTYDQTRKILGNNIKNTSSIPAFAVGVNNHSSAKSSKEWGIGLGTDSKSKSSSKNSSDVSSKSTKDAKNWFEILYELHNHYRKMDQETDKKYFNWLRKAYKQAYSEGLFEIEEYHKYEQEVRQLQKDMLDQMVDNKKHQVTMNKLSDEKYYKWLKKKSKAWYKSGKINLDEYRKYEEEAYTGLKKVQQEKIQKAVENKKHQLSMEQITDAKYYKWLQKKSEQWYKKGKIDLDEYRKYQEEVYSGMQKVYAEQIQEAINVKKHQIAMNKLSDAQYYKWLAQQMTAWYKQAKISAKEFRDYQEEVYSGILSVFDDYLGDIDHQIDMLTESNAGLGAISEWALVGMDAIEREIADARKLGLNNNDEYIQKLQKQWWSYYKKTVEKEKETLDKRLDAIKDFYAKQKELLNKQRDEEKYLDDQAERRKKVTDLETKLSELEYDNSAWAQKRKLELRQELADAQKDLDEFEKDHAIKIAEEMYDKLEELQTKHIEEQQKTIESAQVDYSKIDAGGSPQNTDNSGIGRATKVANAQDQYKTATDAYNASKKTNDSNTKTKNSAQTKATKAYNALLVAASALADAKSKYKANKTKANKAAVKKAKENYKNAKTTNKNAKADLTAAEKALAASSKDLANKLAELNKAKSVLDSLGIAYASGTYNATRGVHRINEHGDEAIFNTADGQTYKLFSGGEHVFTNSATDFLHNFADNPSLVLTSLLKEIGLNNKPSVPGNNISQNISMDIIINGNASDKTVSDIRREQRAQVDYLLKELNRLNK